MGVTVLSAATALGDNTTGILGHVTEHLSKETGVRVEPVEDGPWSSSRAATGDVDLLWACGLLTVELIDAGRLDADIVAAPVFSGQAEPVYHSVVIARADAGLRVLADAFGTRLAINERASWSGNHGFVDHLHREGRSMQMFSKIVVTGSHRRSVEAVVAGQADVASIDHTVWEHLVTVSDVTQGLVVIDHTRDWPAPPFSLRRSIDKSIRGLLRHALTSTPAVPGLERVAPTHPTDYDLYRQARRATRR